MKKNRPQKKQSYTVNGAVVVGLAAGARNVFLHFRDKKEGDKFNWWLLARDMLLGAAAGGFAGWNIGSVVDHYNDLEDPEDTDALLSAIIAGAVLKKQDKAYCSLNEKAEVLIDLIAIKFAGKVRRPYRYGSTESNTALKESADIDLCVECLPGSFYSTEDMFFTIADFLEGLTGQHGITGVRRQHVSIGVYFMVNGSKEKIDVTPNKLTSGAQKQSAGYLYRNNNGIFESPGRTKTDVGVLKNIELSKTQNDILILLKVWKTKEDLPLPSLLLQLLIQIAYEAYSGAIPRKFTDKVVLVLRFIADNIEGIVVRSPENTNNILTDRMSQSDKMIVRDTCKAMIKEYEYQPNSIVKHFN